MSVEEIPFPPEDPEAERQSKVLLEQARAGNQDALGDLLEQCRQYLLYWARQKLDPRLRVKESPSDLVECTFQDALQGFATFRGNSRTQLLRWLHKILKRNLYDAWRRHRQELEREITRKTEDAILIYEELPRESPLPVEKLMTQEALAALEKVYSRLPEDLRLILVLRFHRQMTWKQIGIELGRTPGAARQYYYRLLKEMQEELKDHDDRE